MTPVTRSSAGGTEGDAAVRSESPEGTREERVGGFDRAEAGRVPRDAGEEVVETLPAKGHSLQRLRRLRLHYWARQAEAETGQPTWRG